MVLTIPLCALLATTTLAAEVGLSNVGGRIMNGKKVEKVGEFPYMVSYEMNPRGWFRHVCGGVIISPTAVLTVAGCITDIKEQASWRIKAGTVVTGEAGSSDTKNPNLQAISVAKKIVHPSWVPGKVGPNDIGILILAQPLVFNAFVKPVSLPRAGSVAKDNAVVSGWGYAGGSVNPYYLQTVTVPILPNAQCFEVARNASQVSPYRLQSNICTGPLTGGYGICTGDSGGPLVQNNTLLGLASWTTKSSCGAPGSVSVYTKVENFISFIRENVPDLPK